MTDVDTGDLTNLTVEIVSAFVAHNILPSSDLPRLISETHAALANLGSNSSTPATPPFEPAVTIRKSLASRDHIISMVDGKPYKTLKRHLARHGLTPQEYRVRYNLPPDYPMTAPTYSEQRSVLARELGLGRKGAAVTKGADQKGARKRRVR